MSTPKSWTPELAAEWIDDKLYEKSKRFSQTTRPQQVSFREWCENWDWASRSDVYTHLIHSYPAKLLAYVPIAFLTSSLLPADDTIMDTFAGTGTVLLESIVHKYSPRNCYGVEINPLARLIAKVKTTPLKSNRLASLAKDLYKYIGSIRNAPIPEFENRDFWFRKAAQRDLARIRYCIERMQASSEEKDFFRVCFSSIIRDMSRADPDVAPPVLLKIEKFPKKRQKEIQEVIRKKQRANAIILFRAKVSANLERMQEFEDVLANVPRAGCQIIWDDGRDIRRGKYMEAGKLNKQHAQPFNESVGMVITSPPYMAAQKYVRTTRLELLWLGLVSEDELRALDRATIGAERVGYKKGEELIPVQSETADALLRRVHRSNPERAAIASKYYRDMRCALQSIHRSLKPKGVCILVIGNNTITDIGHLLRKNVFT